ncbi:MAG: preprotein translocase subunit SecA [Proteobacteria bacterium]|nr:preprotein translocase subunit SecA [Pseudomonadota bacterium]MDA1311279.1 preprotein translocase subunit SecA [Pseudomonadota bacterium]
MFGAIAKALFGSENDRVLKIMQNRVEAITALEPQLANLSDEELAGRTRWLKERLTGGETLNDLLEEAFATVREAAKRTLGQRHFDVQLLGGIVLHEGKIAEMKTGEGKTLVATLPVYLNALIGKGVHVVTVNDYLAQRDAAWMGAIYSFLGLSVGVIVHGLTDEERQAAYGADVTYGTNNEFGFDYLRDNMKFRLEDMSQREFEFAIVDEVDSILIDEARTPLIISGPAEDSSELYRQIDVLMPLLVEEDYEKDEKQRTVTLTEAGTEHIEVLLQEHGIVTDGGMYDIQNIAAVHHVNQALRAHKLFARDVDYIVRDDMVVIIDEFTGRAMEGRRYSEGLHQAMEAREGVTIQNENQTLASITFQNYFRLYPKLAGMTGTAMTEASEFAEIYNLEVVEMPTNVDVNREDHDDEVYRTEREKWEAIIDLIRDSRERGQPALVGTVSIEKSETLAALLKQQEIPHQVLNARFHEQEAHIIAQAGEPGAVTIATNMAGRGTDIQLGGNLDMRIQNEVVGDDPAKVAAITADIEAKKADVLAAGGLYVIGTERHESRRIDNQLRGRAGRQGDPGSSKFFLSLDDDLMRIFGSERMDGMLQKLGLEEGEAIIHPWINKALEKAQEKVEARNFEIRKQLLKYDDVMNDQRKVIYDQRKDIMRSDDVSATITDMRHQVVEDLVARTIPAGTYAEQWDIDTLKTETQNVLGLDVPVDEWAREEGIADQEILERLTKGSNRRMAEKVANYGRDLMRMAEKSLLLQIVDQHWKEHLLALDHLRQGINLRAYAQRDPLNEYKREAFNLFEAMLGTLRQTVTGVLAQLEVQTQATPEELEARLAADRLNQGMYEGRTDPALAMSDEERDMLAASGGEDQGQRPLLSNRAAAVVDPDDPATWGKVARNSACPCGSGKKFKHCHGRLG